MLNEQSNSLLAKKLTTFLPLTPTELKRLAEVQSKPLAIKRGKQLVHEGQTGHNALVLQAGWGCSYKDLPNGGAKSSRFRSLATA